MEIHPNICLGNPGTKKVDSRWLQPTSDKWKSRDVYQAEMVLQKHTISLHYGKFRIKCFGPWLRFNNPQSPQDETKQVIIITCCNICVLEVESVNVPLTTDGDSWGDIWDVIYFPLHNVFILKIMTHSSALLWSRVQGVCRKSSWMLYYHTTTWTH